MDPLVTFADVAWDCPFSKETQEKALSALEDGQVVFFPGLAFRLDFGEDRFLSPSILEKSKNVSFNPSTGEVANLACRDEDRVAFTKMIGRYARTTKQLLANLLPAYHPGLTQARTSFRP